MRTSRRLFQPEKNAQKGGVKTQGGKAIVKYNALKHGLLAKEVVITIGEGAENLEEFDALLEDLKTQLLSRKLASAGIIDKKIVSLIHDISPAMNRELHESESYLSESEFEALQHAALSVIAAIEKADENISENEKFA